MHCKKRTCPRFTACLMQKHTSSWLNGMTYQFSLLCTHAAQTFWCWSCDKSQYTLPTVSKNLYFIPECLPIQFSKFSIWIKMKCHQPLTLLLVHAVWPLYMAEQEEKKLSLNTKNGDAFVLAYDVCTFKMKPLWMTAWNRGSSHLYLGLRCLRRLIVCLI